MLLKLGKWYNASLHCYNGFICEETLQLPQRNSIAYLYQAKTHLSPKVNCLLYATCMDALFDKCMKPHFVFIECAMVSDV